MLAGDLQHTLGHLPIRRGVVILIPTGHRLSGRFGILYLRPPVEHPCRGQYLHRTQESLFQILAVIVDAGQPLDRFSDFRQRVNIPFLGQRILLGPRLEGSFLLLLALLNTQFEDAARLADRILPVVRRRGVFRSILNTYLVAGSHILLEDGLALAADKDPVGVRNVQHVVDLVRSHITLRGTREPHDHGEITLLVAVERNLQELLGLVRAVFGRIIRRPVILSGIDAKHREIACMARPHPIIGVTAELADRSRGRSHQTHVGIDLDHEGEILVPFEEGLDLHRHAGVGLLQRSGQAGDILRGDPFVFLLPGRGRHVAQNIRSHVADRTDETHLEPRGGNLLLARHGPKAVLQVVVFDRRQGLYRSVAAVVVGEQQAVGRNDLARAAAAENDDRILERRFVDAVNILGRKFASARLHVPDIHFLQVRQHPHAFVCRRGQRHARRCNQ